MVSTYTSGLRLTKQGAGDNDNTWGDVVNTQFDLIDDAIRGMVTVSVTTGSDVTLSTANGSTDEARKMIIKLSGTPTANINVIVPALTKVYVVDGTDLAGSYSVTVKTTSGSGVAFTAGQNGVVSCDGSDVIEIFKSTTTIPSGLISLWSGTVATIPSGWVLCDGTNSTPDLRDKFIVGARQDDSGTAKTNITGSLTQTGGSADAIVVAHTHDMTVSVTPHSHTYTYGPSTFGVGTQAQATINANRDLNPSGTTSSETVIVSVEAVSAGTAGTNANLPPYYALAFIMKT
jgi:microcystin-dependent protein